MYSSVIRSETYLQCLCDYIRNLYGIDATEIVPAKRGFYGETWRLNTPFKSYFLKLDYSSHQDTYERSFAIIEHLCFHGIDFISRIVKTMDGTLSTRFDGAVLGVFNWIEGENIETDATKALEYQMLAKVYTVPTQGLSIPIEDFSGDSAAKFSEQWKALDCPQARIIFEKNRAKLEHRAARLKQFAELCQHDTSSFFITHGDAGGNLIIDGERHYLVDWDAPILAPPERDAWNMLCYKDWAKELFHASLRHAGIGYITRPERLAYFCYYYYFFYLTEYLDSSAQFDVASEIENYFDGWMENRASYADKHF